MYIKVCLFVRGKKCLQMFTDYVELTQECQFVTKAKVLA